MTFDKNQYWANRREGKRGQGEYPSLIVGWVLQTFGNRAMGRRKVHSTKRSKYSSDAWGIRRKSVADRVANREAVAMQKAHERRERRKSMR